MKMFFTLFAACAIIAARAQTATSALGGSGTVATSSAATADVTGAENFHQFLPRQLGEETRLLLEPMRPNEIRSGHLVYDGILVDLYKNRDPLQLINPAAGADYGNAWDNAAFDQVNGELVGWKFFRISF